MLLKAASALVKITLYAVKFPRAWPTGSSEAIAVQLCCTPCAPLPASTRYEEAWYETMDLRRSCLKEPATDDPIQPEPSQNLRKVTLEVEVAALEDNVAERV